jgi:hypothetical protein
LALAQYTDDKDADTDVFTELQSQLEKTVKNLVSEYRNKKKQEVRRWRELADLISLYTNPGVDLSALFKPSLKALSPLNPLMAGFV